uniref:Uncharacterized protein n=1 Tax=Candidatus Kentrum sp. LPFa TaxID=2126335 RepID=A0A450X905_9GAMM|nr:MAG: hypothetical protein BECKLPF1236A_GA0070988_100285 [Candidatus Kentron sp. LPFa]VFK25681.1 MAG: hypothetical protein BECKLPF1236C_GA0070990_100246 [Candidatus Kentron sp. LPFa]
MLQSALSRLNIPRQEREYGILGIDHHIFYLGTAKLARRVAFEAKKMMLKAERGPIEISSTMP